MKLIQIIISGIAALLVGCVTDATSKEESDIIVGTAMQIPRGGNWVRESIRQVFSKGTEEAGLVDEDYLSLPMATTRDGQQIVSITAHFIDYLSDPIVIDNPKAVAQLNYPYADVTWTKKRAKTRPMGTLKNRRQIDVSKKNQLDREYYQLLSELLHEGWLLGKQDDSLREKIVAKRMADILSFILPKVLEPIFRKYGKAQLVWLEKFRK